LADVVDGWTHRFDNQRGYQQGRLQRFGLTVELCTGRRSQSAHRRFLEQGVEQDFEQVLEWVFGRAADRVVEVDTELVSGWNPDPVSEQGVEYVAEWVAGQVEQAPEEAVERLLERTSQQLAGQVSERFAERAGQPSVC
jgi:hypothetical protein